MTERTNQNETTSENKVHWSFWLGVSFFVFVIIVIICSAWFLNERLEADESVAVTSVKISGEMPYTTRSDINSAIENVELGNYFKVDVNEVQQRILNLPWVYSVSVRKHWPNQLKVYVIDQKPIARWNEDFLLNQFGNAFQAQMNRVKHSIPTFFGPEGSEKVALENYRNFSKLLYFKEMSIDELVLSERFAWQLTLNDGVTLNLGREKRIERIQRFMDAYQQIKDQSRKNNNQQVDYIDLRYDTGLAVGWKPAAVKQRV
ncbi:MAG: FtsQ-type POTRA domain-containing protein [Alteromonadaceae bacterium]|nr:FtsQ-type POTRA domain-containing protein [Alteromonadaceae bacterium]